MDFYKFLIWSKVSKKKYKNVFLESGPLINSYKRIIYSFFVNLSILSTLQQKQRSLKKKKII